MILVTGATGNVGRAVVEQLVAAGQPVRALSRHPERSRWPAGVEAVAGDLVTGVPAAAFAGIEAMHLFPLPNRIGEVLAAAAAAGVAHVTVLSSLGVEIMPDSPLRARHLDVEQAVEASPMTWTHLRPGMFMTNMLQWAELVRREGVVRQAFPDAMAAPIHEQDIATVAVAALLDHDRHAGHAYPMTGPEVLSQRERAAVIAEVTGRAVRFEELARDEAHAALMTNPWMNPGLADTVLDMTASTIGVREGLVVPGLEQLLGHPPRTFAQWVADHRAAFTP